MGSYIKCLRVSKFSAFMQVYKEYIRGGGKIVCMPEKIDIKNNICHSTGVSKKNTLCMLT